jgi:hypothetical protein
MKLEFISCIWTDEVRRINSCWMARKANTMIREWSEFLTRIYCPEFGIWAQIFVSISGFRTLTPTSLDKPREVQTVMKLALAHSWQLVGLFEIN